MTFQESIHQWGYRRILFKSSRLDKGITQTHPKYSLLLNGQLKMCYVQGVLLDNNTYISQGTKHKCL
jgi:hypothetical protein